MKVSLEREAASGMTPEWQRLLVSWTRVMILCGSNFDHYINKLWMFILSSLNNLYEWHATRKLTWRLRLDKPTLILHAMPHVLEIMNYISQQFLEKPK